MWWVRDYQHRKTVTMLNSTDYRDEAPAKVAAMPYAVTPFAWAGIVETPSLYAQVPIDSRSSNIDPTDRARILYKPAETPITLAAKRSPLGRVYLDWSRFPFVETETLDSEQGYVVHFRDLRFDYRALGDLGMQPRGRPPLSADVVLDHNLHVVTMRLGSREERP
jgi:inner membrane protein